LNKEGKDILISLIWNPIVATYPKNWTRAFDLGHYLAESVDVLVKTLQDAGFDIHLFCHSMGNRIFEGITTAFEEKMRFQNIIMTGSDLHLESLALGKPLSKLDRMGKNVSIYMYPNDRILQVSRIWHGKPRVGLSSPSEFNLPYNFIDVSPVIDDKISKGELLNHKYHVNNRTVLKDIGWQIKKGTGSPFRRKYGSSLLSLQKAAISLI
jgi:esterase/lipase superfamily enzyme